MIIVKINGGLGNQLFQYSTARSISLELDRKLLIDNSWYSKIAKYEDSSDQNATTMREYLLDQFNLQTNTISQQQLNKINRVKIYSKNSKLFNLFRMVFLKKLSYKTVNSDNYSIETIKSNPRVYLNGYWQNNDIIEKYRSILLKEFELNIELSEHNYNYLKMIKQADSVAVHFRRGDYISKPNSKQLHVTCSNQYYYDAINYFNGVIGDPLFYIFSDEIDWVRDNIKLPQNTVYIDNNGSVTEHLYLMSNCKHQIIANSTFSWWAAWMNSFTNKIIVSPKHWYYDKKLNETIIRIPSDWVQMDNRIK